MTCEMCTWLVGDYCLRHKRHDFSPCWDYRRIGMKEEEKQDHETIEEDYGDYVKYLDDILPPAEEKRKDDG